MCALLHLSLLAGTGPAGLDVLAAAVGFMLTGAYIGALVWLHVRRWRRRRLRRATALVTSHHEALPHSSQGAAPAPVSEPPVGATPPAPPVLQRRLPGTTLQPLADCLESSRRRAVAESRVAEVLAGLARERWLVERHVVLPGQRVPFVVLGETGVFVLWGLDETPGWEDLPFVNRAAAAIQGLLPGYVGEVRIGLCRAFDPVIPRWWYATESRCGAWVLGVNWLERWLEHFGNENGLANGDVAWTAYLAEPRWRERRPSSLPPTPHVG
jgi:hypothetical protein